MKHRSKPAGDGERLEGCTMRTILLMDDTSTTYGHMAGGCHAGLERHGFCCVFDPGRDSNTGALLGSVEELGRRLIERATKAGAEGLVLDIVWGDNSWNGFDIWDWASANGLALPKKYVVFLTQHRSAGQLELHAEEHGLSHDQVLYKNAQGNEAAVRWFCQAFGADCPCRLERGTRGGAATRP